MPISTNTLLAEGDYCAEIIERGALDISTNTLLAEGDSVSFGYHICEANFNQHPPRGG